MYQKRDDLPELIEALSSGEKRYFTKLQKAFESSKEQPIFLELFQRLQQPESTVANALPGKPSKVVTRAKSWLHANILKSLRVQHDDRSVDIIIQNQLIEVELLYRLSLSGQAVLILTKSLKLARRNERFGLLLQLLDWEKKLNVVLRSPTRPGDEIIEEEHLVLEQYRQVMELVSIYSKARKHKSQSGYVRGEKRKGLKKDTIEARGMVKLEDCLSEKARYYYHYIHTLYCWMTLDHVKGYQHSSELLKPEMDSIKADDHLDGILEHVTSCVCMGLFDEALLCLEMGEICVEKQKLNQSDSYVVKMAAYSIIYKLTIYSYIGDKDKLLNVIQKSMMDLSEYHNYMEKSTHNIIFGNLMIANLAAGNIKMADSLWYNVFNHPPHPLRDDMKADFYLFRLFSQLQNKTYALLPSFALSAIRYYRKGNADESVYVAELPIARLLSKEHEYQKPEILREVFDEIKKILENYIAGLNGIAGFQEQYTRYLIWIESMMTERPFHIVAAEWYKDFRN